jgi:hypothetical protein
MKTILFSIVLIGLTFCASAQLVTNEPSRLQNKIIYYEGKIGSGTSSTDVNYAPVFPETGGVMSATTPGNEHELKWAFVGRNQGKDVYRITITHAMKAGSSSKTSTSKEIEFDDTKMIVFQDELCCVVMESLSAEDLKKAEKH